MTAFQQYVDLDRILREQNEQLVKEVVELMQKNISISYVSRIAKKFTNVRWDHLPADQLVEYLRTEGLLRDDYQYCGRDDVNGCLIFMPRGGFLAGSVNPASIINAPKEKEEENDSDDLHR